MPEKILIRYGEIALKGKNRRYFEDSLSRNLKRAVKDTGARIVRIQGRFLALVPEEEVNQALHHLSRVFGVVSLSVVKPAPLDLAAIKTAAGNLVESLPEQLGSFKVETRRSNKGFPLTSPEINREVGAYLLNRFAGMRVDVHQPSFQLYIEIGPEEALLYHDSISGPGGLPVGVSGRSLLLLSGGIDSPVAGWLAMKRGLSIEAIHFHSFPFTSMRSREKAVDLCRVLARYGETVPLNLVSVTEAQKEIRAKCPEELGIILLRRMMIRTAEAVSRMKGLQALVTGENLGQVASQTLESLAEISAVTGMLILRPLLCMDKQEIVSKSQALDTYEISIRPYEDCCTLFVPRHPVTRPTAERLEQAEAALNIDKLLEHAMGSLETEFIKS
ncbi:MAG: tRNA uracil 4-sulfurtransferase ThiI [Bacillota bacterium]